MARKLKPEELAAFHTEIARLESSPSSPEQVLQALAEWKFQSLAPLETPAWLEYPAPEQPTPYS